MYLCKLQSGQFAILKDKQLYILDWSVTISDLYKYFGDSLILY